MASGYALPITTRGSHHGHSHSYSDMRLSPGRPAANAFPNSNGSVVKKAGSNNSLYTHAETSRETSPINFPNTEQPPQHDHFATFQKNAQAFQENSRQSGHRYTRSWSPMKNRPRGESDLGRPADGRSTLYRPTLDRIPSGAVPTPASSWLSLPEALTSLLVPLPYLFASSAYSLSSGAPLNDFPPLAVYTQSQWMAQNEQTAQENAMFPRLLGAVEACILTSGTLLVVGILGKVQSSERALDHGKGSTRASLGLQSMLNISSLQSMALRALSLGLPFYASMLLGGTRTGLVLIVAISANLTCPDMAIGPSLDQWKRMWSSKVATSVVLILSFITDEAGLTVQTSLTDLILGYLALAMSVLVLPPPFPVLAGTSISRVSPKTSSPLSVTSPWSRNRSGSSSMIATSPLMRSAGDADLTLVGGILLALTTITASALLGSAPTIGALPMLLITLAVASMACSIVFSQPSTLRSQSKVGLALGCLITASCSFLFSPSMWPGTVCNGGLSALSFLGILYDTNGPSAQTHLRNDHDHAHAHAHNVHSHQHHHNSTENSCSAFTKFIMTYCEPGSLVHSILSEKDSRRIAYFTTLNFGFMIVQGAYGYLSGSLGLLSDTVHMFFDCLGLVVGLGAAVASKWPTSPEKPYGWGKLNTLAGFGNGIFLMLVSVEFVWEAIEGIVERRELRHVQELLVVSTLGLLVNMVGLFAFGHAHAGHDHGHSHGHSHDHSHQHTNGHLHSHEHHHGHKHSQECAHDHQHKAHTSHDSHDHHHHNDNMHGIFLHVAADAGGSLAVIISTALTLWKPWYLWDPLATILIAILIFAAAIPLVTSSGQKLLLVIPDELEYNIKSTLQELSELRGVIGYAVPRFWVDDKDEASDSHGHHHHGHGHGGHSGGKQKVMGVIHVIAAPNADLEDVRERVQDLVADRGMDLIIHVEGEAEGCWCGGGSPTS